jgi:hypothetical protein
MSPGRRIDQRRMDRFREHCSLVLWQSCAPSYFMKLRNAIQAMHPPALTQPRNQINPRDSAMAIAWTRLVAPSFWTALVK